ncbi:MAG: Ig-like domain-containing protein, partial [Balneolaceae bacterium]|nr:Ig-like domain-containing protein [Balneolaceae bacterium]
GSVTFTAEAERPSGIQEISETVEVNFIPEAPISLSATEVDNNGFVANWELVEGVDTYRLDVATDENFETYASGYQGIDLGLTTNYEVTDLEPGKVYYYRVRTEKEGLSSANSEIVEVITFPKVPILNSPENTGATLVNANWQEAAGAQEYLIDVARDQEFTDYVSNYEKLNVGDQTSYEITDLEPGTTYYIRVRSKAFTRLSEPSTTINVETAEIGITQTEITPSQLRVLANGEQENLITVFLRDSENEIIIGETITLVPNSENTQIRSVQPVTGENGEAIYAVTSNTPGEINYTAVVADRYEAGEVSIEFLQVEGVLKLGENYPNPFNSQTTIPVTIPNRMQIKITVANVIGASVKTVIDKQLKTGYYEIPVNLGDVATGTYFYRLRTDDDVKTKKMLLVK